MKKFLSTALLFTLSLVLFSQEYLSGKLTGSGNNSSEIYYDRTQNVIKSNFFQTIYKVFDKNKVLIYTVYLNNDRLKNWIVLAAKAPDKPATTFTVTYERSKSGLVFCNRGSLDTSFSIVKDCSYLFSFPDTNRDYPVLHIVKVSDGNEISLDPLSKLRIRKHIELVRNIFRNDPDNLIQKEERELRDKKERDYFMSSLWRMRDSLYAKKSLYANSIKRIRADIENDISVLFKDKKIFEDAKRYEGEKKSGVAQGRGLFMANANYYSGEFDRGKFVSGIVIIQFDAFEYFGEYSKDSLNGLGFVKYPNEDYLSGIFKEGNLVYGITYSTTKSGEVYLGTIKNGQKAGYGEYYNVKGEMYYGVFSNGLLVRGYSKDADPFGYFMYSKIEQGVKTAVDAKEGEAFFDHLSRLKQ